MHLELLGGRARQGAAYPPKLGKTVLKALRKQLTDDRRLSAIDLKVAGPNPSGQLFPTNQMERSELE